MAKFDFRGERMQRARFSLAGTLQASFGIAVIAFVASVAKANSITASLQGVDLASSGYTTVDIQVGTHVFNHAIAGAELWHKVSGTGSVAQGTDFKTYCIEVFQDVYLTSPASSYLFDFYGLSDAPKPGEGVTGLGSGTGMGSTKAALISELWGRDYTNALSSAANEAAFQLAIWKIVYETPLGGSLNLTLNTGNFQALSTTNSSIRSTSQTYLNGLDGKGTMASLLALSSPDYQDQITDMVPPPTTTPLPSALSSGLGLLAIAAVFHRRPRGVALATV
jgi:hypothetical protein